MAVTQQLVVEHGSPQAPQQQPVHQHSEPGQPPQLMPGKQGEGSSPVQEADLVRRMAGVGPQKAKAMLSTFGQNITAVLDAPDAAQQLLAVRGIGPVSAVRFKRSWDSSATCAGNQISFRKAAFKQYPTGT